MGPNETAIGTLFLIASPFVIGGLYLWMRASEDQVAAGEHLARLDDAYRRALDYLALHPTDPSARASALQAGRAFYADAIRDTFTLHIGETMGTSDHQNNTTAREARIAADIEARIGHLKVPSPSSEANTVTADTTTDDADFVMCPSCAEKVRRAAKICRYCRDPLPIQPPPTPKTTPKAPASAPEPEGRQFVAPGDWTPRSLEKLCPKCYRPIAPSATNCIHCERDWLNS